jgi:polyphosphate kinase
LAAISQRTHAMVKQQYACYTDLEAKLAEAGVRRVRAADLTVRRSRAVEQVFESEIFSVLTPMAVRPDERVPLLVNQTLHVCVQLAPSEDNPDQPRRAIIPLGRALPRFFTLSADRGYSYVLLEDLVTKFIGRFFPGEKVAAQAVFRITRNADFTLRDDLAVDLLAGMEGILSARKRGECVRLEIDAAAGPELTDFLTQSLVVGPDEVFVAGGPLDLAAQWHVADLKGFDALKYEPWPPQRSPDVDPTTSLLETIARGDVLLYHPYQSFDPVVRLVEEAAADPDVLAIKQILYRTSRNSPIGAALAKAAQRGKHVTAIVELKARFDEARTSEWARKLEELGVLVIYGV